MTRVAYYIADQLYWTNRRKTESPIAAVARRIKELIGTDVTIWYAHDQTLQRGDGHDVYVAKWFDSKTETFREENVIL